jgi:ERCC4-type nuclease
MNITVDDREKAVIPYMDELADKYNINYNVQRCLIGDYTISYKNMILIAIERKTWTDLASSMRDGRKENIKKLMELRDKTDCQLAYLIEGDATPNFTAKFGRLPYKNLRAHLDHIAFRDGIHMIYSKNEQYTAERLFELATNYLTIKELIKDIDDEIEEKLAKQLPNGTQVIKVIRKKPDGLETEPETKPEPEPEIKPVKLEDAAEILSGNIGKLQEKTNTEITIEEQLLRCIPKIGSIVSALLAENGITFRGLYDGIYDIDTISVLKYPSGAMIGAKAKTIFNIPKIIDNEKYHNTHIKILNTIPLISKKTATIILDTFTMSDIMSGAISLEDIADIRKTEKSRIGPKAASNIYNYLGIR